MADTFAKNKATLIKLVAKYLQGVCKECDDCRDCEYHIKEHCIFTDIPYEWDVDKLKEDSNDKN